MTYEIALQAMESYSERKKPQNEEEAEIFAYQTWAVTELYFRVVDRPFEDPENILWKFCAEMAEYSGLEVMKDRKINPFIIAYDVGISLLRMVDHPRED